MITIVFFAGLIMLIFFDDSVISTLGIILILLSFFTMVYYDNITPKIDLPEQYELITEDDCLRGRIDSTGVLHIEFNNK